jgi:hypothetical protein
MYQDAMVIVRRFGKPDIFVTMTCNPNWPEIQESIFAGQNPVDRPDVIARVFRQKNQALLDDILKCKIFGQFEAYVQVIEFQKRGLPHSHSLFIIQDKDKLKSTNDYDKLVTAQLPPPELETLRESVKRHMIHGPCEQINTKAPCMKDGTCTKQFPKPFCAVTSTNSSGYPTYRRLDNGDYVEKNGVPMDNRWVVPYNPFLIAKYECTYKCGSLFYCCSGKIFIQIPIQRTRSYNVCSHRCF